jgi:NADH-quinone oxidoreductase subunit J
MLLFFYLFATIAIVACIGVICSKNSIYSLIFLVLSFLNVAAIMIILGSEFIALSMIILQAGASIILFLFVIMMVDIKHHKYFYELKKYNLVNISIGIILCIDVLSIIFFGLSDLTQKTIFNKIYTTVDIGNILYNDYLIVFEICGIILFSSILSCVILITDRKFIKKQIKVNLRNKDNSIYLVNTKISNGVKNINYDE